MTKTYVVTAQLTVKRGELTGDDNRTLWEITEPFRVEADSEDAALDKYHSTVPVSCLEHFDFSVREGKPLKRFYVSMTWDNWPEGGSYGTKVWAEDHEDAEFKCRSEMAVIEAQHSTGPDDDAYACMEDYHGDWNVVDCYEIEPTKVWCLAHMWEGQPIPIVRAFASKAAAEKAIAKDWEQYRRDADIDEETPLPAIYMSRAGLLTCHFGSDYDYWITEATMDVEEDN